MIRARAAALEESLESVPLPKPSNGKQAAKLIAVACSKRRRGSGVGCYGCWPSRRCEQMVEYEIVDELSQETVRGRRGPMRRSERTGSHDR